MEKEHTAVVTSKTYRLVVILCIAMCIMAAGLSFRYYKSLHATIRDESKVYLQEISERIGSNLNRIIEDNFLMLYMLAASLEASDSNVSTDLKSLLKNQREYLSFDDILLVDAMGVAYDVDNELSVFLTFDDILRDNLLGKQRAMATTQIVNNKEYLIFAVPLNNVVIDGREMISLVATNNPAVLEQTLSMTSFNEQAYSQIITKSGTVVTRPNLPHAIKSGYNIFATLQTAELDNGANLEKIKLNIVNDVGDQISFSLDGERRYMVYTPIQPDEWFLLTFVPFHAVNEKSDLLLRTTLFICGVITLAFCGFIAVLLYIFTANRKKLERIAYIDAITGGNTIQRFYELAKNALDAQNGVRYAMMYSNIENFKVLNSQIGRETCDDILRYFTCYVQQTLQDGECFGRLMADHFCLLYRYEDESAFMSRMQEWCRGAEKYIQQKRVVSAMPVTEFGVYVIEDSDLPLTEMIDCAKLALNEQPICITNRLRYALYNENARRQLFREKRLADMMEDALKNGEFKLFLQPKYHLPDEHIDGAEALVRWRSVTDGMIFPDEFISVFEKNGFIVQLDHCVFELVCSTLQSWIARGLQPMKISVNCSRVHLKNENFLEPYIAIASKYNVDKSLIEIELTESVVFEDSERLLNLIGGIHKAGFGCSMDDFGSGYSSLNLIQSIPVDTLKIDRIFFQQLDEIERTQAVVGSIVRMAKELEMTTVAEGVEFKEQVEMLKNVECDYIQGYVFAKPMSVEDFEKLAFGI